MKYNLAFYTYFIGTDSNPAFMIPPLPSETYPCYFFTNNHRLLKQLKKTKWIGVFIDKQTDDDVIESNMIGKHIKVLPHEYHELKDYDYLCCFDTKLPKVNVEFVELCIQHYFIQDNKLIIFRKHNYPKKKGDVVFEFNRSIDTQPRYKLQKEQYLSYITSQLKKNLKQICRPGLVCSYSIRNMKHSKMIEFNNTWYEHIQQCGIQDQISFHFVKQLFYDLIVPVPFHWKKLVPKYFDKFKK